MLANVLNSSKTKTNVSAHKDALGLAIGVVHTSLQASWSAVVAYSRIYCYIAFALAVSAVGGEVALTTGAKVAELAV